MVKISELAVSEYEKRKKLQMEIEKQEALLDELEQNLKNKRQLCQPTGQTENLKEEPVIYAIEKKFNGFRALIHKKGGEVKIFSDQAKDITFPFPTAEQQAKTLSAKDFIIDCEMVPHDEKGSPLGRAEAAKYIGAAKSRKEIDDSRIKFYAFDLLYLDKDLTKEGWEVRNKLLSKMDFGDNIKYAEPIIVKNKADAEKAVRLFSGLKGSEGAVIKRLNGTYHLGKETDEWIKYRTLLPVQVRVIKPIPVKGTSANVYSTGIDLTADEAEKINPKYIIEAFGKKLMDAGNTFNTAIKASGNDIIDLLVEEIWRHKYKDGTIRYSLHKPNVKGASAEKTTSSIGKLDGYAVARGEEVQEFGELAEDEGNAADKATQDFPNRMQENLKANIGKWNDFVMQWHYRGHETPTGHELDSLHCDFRMDVGNHLEGLTILSPTTVDKSVPDLVEKGKWKNVRCVLKAPQPKGWLKVEGILERGKPGTTKGAPAVFVIVAKGKYSPEIVGDHKIQIAFRAAKGDTNSKVFGKAAGLDISIAREPADKLKELPDKVSFHIAHIGDKWIILSDEVLGND